jgi:hypothetical protein
MKLHRHIELIASTELKEAQGPVPLKLTLDEIITAGKVTNPYQIFALGWLSEFFKKGLKSASLELENPISFDSHATHTDVVTALKAMSPANQVQLAQYLKDCIDAGESLLHTKDMDVVEWMKFVLHAQR